MNQLNNLFNDPHYVAELFNSACTKRGDFGESPPVNAEWIDLSASEQVTEAFHGLLPDGIPYLTCVIVEKNPDTLYNGVCVDDNTKRQRYIVIAVIPDTEHPYDQSFPFILQSWTIGLVCWENIRATLAACAMDFKVVLKENPVPPILNNAKVEWVCLYLGRKPFSGINSISEQTADVFFGHNIDIHLYEPGNMESTPVIQRLIDAYESDYTNQCSNTP